MKSSKMEQGSPYVQRETRVMRLREVIEVVAESRISKEVEYRQHASVTDAIEPDFGTYRLTA